MVEESPHETLQNGQAQAEQSVRDESKVRWLRVQHFEDCSTGSWDTLPRTHISIQSSSAYVSPWQGQTQIEAAEWETVPSAPVHPNVASQAGYTQDEKALEKTMGPGM